MSNTQKNRELKEIIAFDLDGTLVASKQKITEKMAKLLCVLSLKTKIAIISGGSYHQFKEQIIPTLLSASGENSENVGNAGNLENIIFLPTSGRSRYEFDSKTKNWEVNYSMPIPEDIKNKVLAQLNKIVIDHKEFFEIPSEHFGNYIEDRGNQITLSAVGQEAPIEAKQVWDPTGDKRRKIIDAIQQAVPEIEAHAGGMTSVDILPKGYDKAVGLKVLLDDLGLRIPNMLFVGDAIFEGGNDYSPLQAGIECKSVASPEDTERLIESLL